MIILQAQIWLVLCIALAFVVFAKKKSRKKAVRGKEEEEGGGGGRDPYLLAGANTLVRLFAPLIDRENGRRGYTETLHSVPVKRRLFIFPAMHTYR